jgi:predicted RNase H-like nuclease (RuvC/YqgF family)
MENLNEIIIPSITAFFASVITWIFGRKKEEIDLQSTEITNVQEAIKIWREMANDMKQEVAELKIKVETLTTEIHNLRTENIELRSKLDEDKPKRTRPTKAI